MLNVLVVGPESLSGEIGPTVLGRPDVDRIHVEHPGAALEAAERWRVALVVIDLPADEACSLTRSLRAGAATRHCAIVWIDRAGDARAREAVRGAGASEAVPLPVDPLLWDRRLEELLTVSPRVLSRVAARLHDGAELLRGADETGALLLNVGARGVLLECARELGLGCKIGLSFALPGQAGDLALVGQVVRRADAGAGRFRFGVEFLIYRGDARERIAAFVASEPDPARPGAAGSRLLVRAFEQPREWEEELRTSEVRKALILDSSPESIVTVDAQGRVVEWNAAARRLFGYSRTEVIGREVVELLVPPADRERFRALLRELAEEGDLPDADRPQVVTALRADGSQVSVELSASPAYVRGQLLVTGYLRDLSARRRQDRLIDARQRATRALTASLSLAEAAPAVLEALVAGLGCEEARLWLLDGSPERLVLAGSAPPVSGPAEDALVRQALEVTAVSWEEPAARSGGVALAVPIRVAGQSLGALEVRSTRLRDRRQDWPELLSAVASELGLFLERLRSEEELQRLARYDGLTGLPNRSFFLETLQRTIARAARQSGRLAVVFVDLDGFKVVNDELGHAAGDEVLRAVADRLRGGTRTADVIARIGGDEFVVLVPSLSRPDDAASVARTLIEKLAEPFQVEGRRLRLGASAGIAVHPEDGSDADTLLKHADLAMYRAKHEGRNGYRFFAAEMGARAQERQQLLEGLRAGIERHELELEYLPVLEGGRATALEALVRWRHPRRGLVPTSVFLAEAEESGLIVELGAAVLRAAARAAAGWHRSDVRLSLDVSGRQLREPHFFETVRQALAVSGLPAGRLELDLTEATVMTGDEEVVGRLRRLRALGVRLALDEFGTAAFSIGRLRTLGFDTLKLGRGLVSRLPSSVEDALQVDAALALARVLGLGVVAGGIETEAQRAFLESRGVGALQGPLLGPPLGAAEVNAYLTRLPLR